MNLLLICVFCALNISFSNQQFIHDVKSGTGEVSAVGLETKNPDQSFRPVRRSERSTPLASMPQSENNAGTFYPHYARPAVVKQLSESSSNLNTRPTNAIPSGGFQTRSKNLFPEEPKVATESKHYMSSVSLPVNSLQPKQTAILKTSVQNPEPTFSYTTKETYNSVPMVFPKSVQASDLNSGSSSLSKSGYSAGTNYVSTTYPPSLNSQINLAPTGDIISDFTKKHFPENIRTQVNEIKPLDDREYFPKLPSGDSFRQYSSLSNSQNSIGNSNTKLDADFPDKGGSFEPQKLQQSYTTENPQNYETYNRKFSGYPAGSKSEGASYDLQTKPEEKGVIPQQQSNKPQNQILESPSLKIKRQEQYFTKQADQTDLGIASSFSRAGEKVSALLPSHSKPVSDEHFPKNYYNHYSLSQPNQKEAHSSYDASLKTSEIPTVSYSPYYQTSYGTIDSEYRSTTQHQNDNYLRPLQKSAYGAGFNDPGYTESGNNVRYQVNPDNQVTVHRGPQPELAWSENNSLLKTINTGYREPYQPLVSPGSGYDVSALINSDNMMNLWKEEEAETSQRLSRNENEPYFTGVKNYNNMYRDSYEVAKREPRNNLRTSRGKLFNSPNTSKIQRKLGRKTLRVKEEKVVQDNGKNSDKKPRRLRGFLRILDVIGRRPDDIVDRILNRSWDRAYRRHRNCWHYNAE